MIITTRGRNALKLMVDLSCYQEDKFVKLKDIAAREDISEKYLEQIVACLQRANKVISARGANGGYRLAKQPAQYSVGEIVKCLDGELHPTNCTYSKCPNTNSCLCYPLWEKLDTAINDVLENTTLQDLLDWDAKAI